MKDRAPRLTKRHRIKHHRATFNYGMQPPAPERGRGYEEILHCSVAQAEICEVDGQIRPRTFAEASLLVSRSNRRKLGTLQSLEHPARSDASQGLQIVHISYTQPMKKIRKAAESHLFFTSSAAASSPRVVQQA